jgi:hypothetical protein
MDIYILVIVALGTLAYIIYYLRGFFNGKEGQHCNDCPFKEGCKKN